MKESDLVAELEALGIGKSNYKLVLLLPLIQVAWADGAIQPSERYLILHTARKYGIVDPAALALVEGWLTKPPGHEVHLRARRVVVALAHRMRGLGSDVPHDALDRIESLCYAVARSAGGLLGLFFTLDPRERDAIQEITESLQLEENAALDHLPSPLTSGAGWRTLQLELSTMLHNPHDEDDR